MESHYIFHSKPIHLLDFLDLSYYLARNHKTLKNCKNLFTSKTYRAFVNFSFHHSFVTFDL